MKDWPEFPLFKLLLGPAGRQRRRVSALLMSGGICAALAAAMLAQAQFGLAEREPVQWLSTAFLVTWTVFYVLIRSGISERWADPGLTAPQAVFGLVAAAVAYGVSGPARGAQLTLIVMAMALGLFNLPATQARWIAGSGLFFFALLIGWKIHAAPQRHPPVVELVHFGYAAASVAAVLGLISRLAALRAHLGKLRVELKAALSQIRVLSTQDELTSLNNRRHMIELMAVEKARQQRSGRVMSVAMIDIDAFKRINDTYGHAGGDLVLKTFSQFGRGSLRPTDILARWGGAEFLLLLPETSGEDAMLCVERMRAHFTRMSADVIAPGLHVTFSAGVSQCKVTDKLEDAVEQANQAMYRAREQGSNRSVLG